MEVTEQRMCNTWDDQLSLMGISAIDRAYRNWSALLIPMPQPQSILTFVPKYALDNPMFARLLCSKMRSSSCPVSFRKRPQITQYSWPGCCLHLAFDHRCLGYKHIKHDCLHVNQCFFSIQNSMSPSMKGSGRATPFCRRKMPKCKRCSGLGKKCIKASSSLDFRSNTFSPYCKQDGVGVHGPFLLLQKIGCALTCAPSWNNHANDIWNFAYCSLLVEKLQSGGYIPAVFVVGI
jgi:hypothetical protein